MEAREKKLGFGFLAVCLVALFLKFVYPDVIRPMFDYGDQLAEAEDDLSEKEEELEELETKLQAKYREYVLRSGSTSPSDTKDDLYYAIGDLINSAKLKGQTVSPKEENIDRKSNVATLKFSVSARGTFAQCIDFVRAFYKMPYVARITSLKLDPTHSNQRADHDEVELDAEIEAKVLPTAEDWGIPGGTQPTDIDLVATKNIRSLRGWRPFNAYQEPTRPPTPTPTPTPGPGKTPGPTPSPPPPSGPDTWPDAGALVLRGIHRMGDEEYRVEEAMLANLMDKSTQYVSVGEDFDGGELVLLHAMGAVAHKVGKDEDFGYWVYPIGELLNERMELAESAREWPEIYVAVQQYFRKEKAAKSARQARADEAAEAARLAAEVAQSTENITDVQSNGVIDDAIADALSAEAGAADSNGAQANANTSGVPMTSVVPAAKARSDSSKNPKKSRRGRRRAVQQEAKESETKTPAIKGKATDSKSSRSADRLKNKTKKRSSAKRPRTRVPAIAATPKPAGNKAADKNKETDDVAPPE